MPTDPTARDVETARAIMASYRETPMWWSTEMAVSMATDAIARALATARVEEREACAALADAKVRPLRESSAYSAGAVLRRGINAAAKDIAAAIRARGEGER